MWTSHDICKLFRNSLQTSCSPKRSIQLWVTTDAVTVRTTVKKVTASVFLGLLPGLYCHRGYVCCLLYVILVDFRIPTTDFSWTICRKKNALFKEWGLLTQFVIPTSRFGFEFGSVINGVISVECSPSRSIVVPGHVYCDRGIGQLRLSWVVEERVAETRKMRKFFASS